jgi:hypothetical protein
LRSGHGSSGERKCDISVDEQALYCTSPDQSSIEVHI